jgi:hypothetical protein
MVRIGIMTAMFALALPALAAAQTQQPQQPKPPGPHPMVRPHGPPPRGARPPLAAPHGARTPAPGPLGAQVQPALPPGTHAPWGVPLGAQVQPAVPPGTHAPWGVPLGAQVPSPGPHEARAPLIYRGRPINRVHAAPFVYPRGWGYRRWAVGAVLPPLFLTGAYFFSDWAALGLAPPEPGFQWVRYGADLLLVDMTTGEIVDVIYGVFY